MILTIGFLSTLQAQEPVFEFLTQGEEYSNYESLFLDPNYDKNYQISSYSMSDLINIRYKYNDRNQIVQKEIFIPNEKYFDYDTGLIVDYKYDDKGYLIEKRSSFSDFRDGNRYLTSVSYNDTYTIDTTTVCSNQEQLYNFDYSESLLRTIRYWNNDRTLLDSIYLILDYTNNTGLKDSSIGKYVFSYDDQNRCSKVRSFRKSNIISDPNVQWIPWYKAQFEYKHNQTICNQTFITQGFTIIPNVDTKNSDIVIGKLTYTIKRDDHNRIVSKQLDNNDSTLYLVKYKYDNKGRTSVEMNMKESEQIAFLSNKTLYQIMLPMYVHLLKDNYSMSGSIEYSIRYEGNVQISKFNMQDSSSHIVLKRRCIYDPTTNKLLSIENEETDNKKWAMKKANFSYLANDTVLITAFQYEKDGDYDPLAKTLYKNDKLGRRIYTEKYEYSKSDSAYIPYEKKINQYDSSGNICFYEYYLQPYRFSESDDTSLQWYGSRYERIKRDPENNRIESIWREWNDNQWADSITYLAQYDDKNRPILEEVHLNPESKLDSGKEDFKLTASYDDANNIITDIVSVWDANQKSWVYSSKRETQYNGYLVDLPKQNPLYADKQLNISNCSDIIENRFNGYKEPSSGYRQKTETVYDWYQEKKEWIKNTQKVKISEGNKKINSSYTWDTDQNRWIGIDQDIKESNDTLDITIYNQWDSDINDWIGYSKQETIDTKNISSDASYEWDNINEDWKLVYRHVTNADHTSQEERYESNYVGDKLVGTQREITFYDTEGNTRQTIYYKKDLTDQDWIKTAILTTSDDNTYTYDLYDNDNETWVHALQYQESVDSIGSTINEKRIWQNGSWIKSLKTEMKYGKEEDIDIEPIVQVLYTYDADKQLWVPLYQIPNNGFIKKEYQKWNAETNRMENYLRYDYELSTYSLWDAKKNEYVTVDLDTVQDELESIFMLFNTVQRPYSYRGIISSYKF